VIQRELQYLINLVGNAVRKRFDEGLRRTLHHMNVGYDKMGRDEKAASLSYGIPLAVPRRDDD